MCKRDGDRTRTKLFHDEGFLLERGRGKGTSSLLRSTQQRQSLIIKKLTKNINKDTFSEFSLSKRTDFKKGVNEGKESVFES